MYSSRTRIGFDPSFDKCIALVGHVFEHEVLESLCGKADAPAVFDERIDPEINARAVALADALRVVPIGGVRDVVPTYRTVTVFFDPLKTEYDELVHRLEREAANTPPAAETASSSIRIPVRYGGAFGPDLAAVAAFAGLAESDVVALHVSTPYRVFMLGFVAGFAYMGAVDERIAMPRRATPRVRVPAGAVGIAGRQTGVYPMETPGGWQIIGRTSLQPFDPRREPPFLLKAGDTVRFYAIDEASA